MVLCLCGCSSKSAYRLGLQVLDKYTLLFVCLAILMGFSLVSLEGYYLGIRTPDVQALFS